jgi:hypothetical protein
VTETKRTDKPASKSDQAPITKPTRRYSRRSSSSQNSNYTSRGSSKSKSSSSSRQEAYKSSQGPVSQSSPSTAGKREGRERDRYRDYDKDRTGRPKKESISTHTPDSSTNSNLWKIINRFDLLINSTNSKAALIIAFNTFVLGGLLLKWADLLPIQPAYLNTAGIVALSAASLASIVSLVFTIMAITPYLESHDYHSDLYFKDIASLPKGDVYLERVNQMQSEILTKDLSFQIHVLASGLKKKFQCLKVATLAIFCAQIPAILILIVLKIIASFTASPAA